MEFWNFNRIFWNLNEKYTFYQKLCETKFVDLIQNNKFEFLRFFRISHIIDKKIEFRIFNSIFLY